MRIFVTGGGGFIGSHLLPLLALGNHQVLCLSHAASIGNLSAALSTIQGDLSTPESYAAELERFKPESCIHLAWGGLPDYSIENCCLNLLAGIKLFEMLGQVGCRKIIALGTCWEYGKHIGAVKEDDQGIEPNMFGAFKTALHTIGKSNCMTTESRFIWARPFFVYGPGQRLSSLIPSCYGSLKLGEVPKITSPLAVNDFIHVADVAAAIRVLVEADEVAGIYNIGSGHPTAVWQVANLIAVRMGIPPVYHDLPAAAPGFWADIAKTRLLGWQPEISLEAGIAQTLQALETDQ
jgi:nucleoside-diphosphate-sugar epimerase